MGGETVAFACRCVGFLNGGFFFFFFDTGSARTAVELAMINGLMQYIKIVKTIMEFFDDNEPRLNFVRFSGVLIFHFCKLRKTRRGKNSATNPSVSVGYDRHLRSWHVTNQERCIADTWIRKFGSENVNFGVEKNGKATVRPLQKEDRNSLYRVLMHCSRP